MTTVVLLLVAVGSCSLISASSFAGGFFAGKRQERKSHGPSAFTREIESLKSQLKETQEASDKFKKIAASHEIKMPGSGKVTINKDFGSYDYHGTIDDNFACLEQDLKKIKSDEFHIEPRIYIIGDWKKHLKAHYNFSSDFGTSEEFGKLHTHFYGSLEKVLSEFRKFLQDSTWCLWDKKAGQWFEKDSSMNIQVKVVAKIKNEVNTEDLKVVYVEVAVPEPKRASDTDILMQEAEQEIERLSAAFQTAKQREI